VRDRLSVPKTLSDGTFDFGSCNSLFFEIIPVPPEKFPVPFFREFGFKREGRAEPSLPGHAVGHAIVVLVIHWMADPVPGLGIAVPVFMPVVVTAIIAVILWTRRRLPTSLAASAR